MSRKLALRPGERRWIDRGVFARGTRQGIVYGISYTYRGKRRLEVVGPTLTLARTALAVRKAEIAQGRYRLEATRRLPRFPDFATRYLEDYSRPNKRSAARDEWALKKAVEFFGPRRLSEVTAWEAERYRAARVESGVSTATANRDLALLKHMMTMAVRWGLLATNPLAEVKLRREEERPFRVLSSAEEGLLLAACSPHLRDLVTLALNTGLRHGELVALDWRDVDLGRRELTVRRSKSGRVRRVPLNEAALGVLRALPDREGPVVLWRGRGVTWARKGFASAVRRAGLPHLRLHDLRHSFVSRLVEAGTPLPVVQLLAGHANIQTTLRYAHVSEDQKREAVNLLGHANAQGEPATHDPIPVHPHPKKRDRRS